VKLGRSVPTLVHETVWTPLGAQVVVFVGSVTVNAKAEATKRVTAEKARMMVAED
jgi:hypothetical protein